MVHISMCMLMFMIDSIIESVDLCTTLQTKLKNFSAVAEQQGVWETMMLSIKGIVGRQCSRKFIQEV